MIIKGIGTMRYFFLKIIFFLVLCSTFGCKIPQKMEKIILPIDFTGLNLVLGEKINDELLKNFVYDDSLDAYYLKLSSSYYFDEIYLWIKNKIIIKIMLEKGNILMSEYQRFEKKIKSILQFLEQKYGLPKVNTPNYCTGNIILDNFFHLSWNYGNVTIEFNYLSKENYEKINDSITNDHVWYTIIYSIPN